MSPVTANRRLADHGTPCQDPSCHRTPCRSQRVSSMWAAPLATLRQRDCDMGHSGNVELRHLPRIGAPLRDVALWIVAPTLYIAVAGLKQPLRFAIWGGSV